MQEATPSTPKPVWDWLPPRLSERLRVGGAISPTIREPILFPKVLEQDLDLLEAALILQGAIATNPESVLATSELKSSATLCHRQADKLISALRDFRQELLTPFDPRVAEEKSTAAQPMEKCLAMSTTADSDGSCWSSPNVGSSMIVSPLQDDVTPVSIALETLPGFDSPAPPMMVDFSLDASAPSVSSVISPSAVIPPRPPILSFLQNSLASEQSSTPAHSSSSTSCSSASMSRQRRIRYIQEAEFADLCSPEAVDMPRDHSLDRPFGNAASLSELLGAVHALWARMRSNSQAYLRDAIQMGQLLRALYSRFQRKRRGKSGDVHTVLTWKQWLRAHIRVSFVSISLYQGVADIAEQFPGLRNSNWVLHKIQKHGHAKLLAIMKELQEEGQLNPRWKNP